MECTLLTLNNACHGIFLDTFELYNLDWGKKPEHNYWSATIFYVFRLAFDAFALLYLFGALPPLSAPAPLPGIPE